MKIKKLSPGRLEAEKRLDYSYPWKKERCDEIINRFSGFPLIVIDNQNKVVFGHDFIPLLLEKKSNEIEVLQLVLNGKEALLLNYNLRAALLGVNLWEKLIFLKLGLPMMAKTEIYHHTPFDLPINKEVVERIDQLTTTGFKELLAYERVGLKTALRICRQSVPDQQVLIDLFMNHSFTFSQQLMAIEWLEEICFRDKIPMGEVLDLSLWSKLSAKEMAAAEILNRIRCHRFPRYCQHESQWQEELARWQLSDNINVSHAPFFDSNEINVTIRVPDMNTLKTLLPRIKGS